MNEETEKTREKISDVADRLLQLMRRIKEAASEVQIRNNNRFHSALSLPLHQSFGPLAYHLNFENYSELRDNFISLCDRASRDIGALPIRRSGTQERWLEAISTAREVFEAKNFGESCNDIFAKHFSTEVCDRLQDMSERLQTHGISETPEHQLKEALDAARKAMNAYETNGKIPSSLGMVLKHYLQQIEAAYQRYEDFAEESFWSSYKQLFATFLQTHSTIVPEDQSEEIKEAMAEMGAKMSYGLKALSIVADATTIASGGAMLALAAI